jgi:hypothetical protein
MSLVFDHEELTPDGHWQLRRVPVEGPHAQQVAKGIVVLTAGALYDWYLSRPDADRWARYGQTSEPLPENRFRAIEGETAGYRLAEILAAHGKPWETLEPPESGVREEAREYGASGSVAIVDGESIVERYRDQDDDPPAA